MPNLDKNKPKLKEKPWWRNFVVVGVLNILSLIAIVVFANLSNRAAAKLNETRTKNLESGLRTEGRVLQSDLEKNRVDAEKLASIFPNDERLIQFITNIEQLRAQGAISEFSASGQIISSDSNGYPGIPVSFVLKGTEGKINESFAKIQSLSVIINPVLVSVTKSDDGSFSYNFGGLLYVSQELN